MAGACGEFANGAYQGRLGNVGDYTRRVDLFLRSLSGGWTHGSHRAARFVQAREVMDRDPPWRHVFSNSLRSLKNQRPPRGFEPVRGGLATVKPVLTEIAASRRWTARQLS